MSRGCAPPMLGSRMPHAPVLSCVLALGGGKESCFSLSPLPPGFSPGGGAPPAGGEEEGGQVSMGTGAGPEERGGQSLVHSPAGVQVESGQQEFWEGL